MDSINRRGILGVIIAALFAPLVKIASASTVAKPKRKLKITYEKIADGGWLGKVVGSEKDLIAFYEAWKTSMWPEWRTDASDHGRNEYEKYKSQIAEGLCGLFWLGFKSEDWLVRSFGDAVESCWDRCDSVEPMPDEVCRRHGISRATGTRTCGLMSYWTDETELLKEWRVIEKVRHGKNQANC